MYVLGLIATIFILLFAIVNWQEVKVNLIFFEFKTYVTLLILLCGVLGYASSTVWNYRKTQRKDQEIERLQNEINRLKSQGNSANKEVE